LAWGIAYDKAFDAACDANIGGYRRNPRNLIWRASTWRPNEELHRLFRNIGREQHGDELEEDWTDPQCCDDLLDHDSFSGYKVFPLS
jgi:hypothetical protein